MPELPEVEVLLRHLAPLLKDKTIRDIAVHRTRIIRPDTTHGLRSKLVGATFRRITRRAKFLVFELSRPRKKDNVIIVGHLGMTGRMYLQSKNARLPKHAAVTLEFSKDRFVFEDTRYFGRFTSDLKPLETLGPEPLSDDFTVEAFQDGLRKSSQPVKVKVLDQKLVVGVGNIYASEALFRAGVSPKTMARRLTKSQVTCLWKSIREVLTAAIDKGSTIPLDFSGDGTRDGIFYYGTASEGYEERLLVYDREGESCTRCRTKILRIVQSSRSTYFCPECQRSKKKH